MVQNTNINTPEWPNSHKLKIQDGGDRHLEFRKNVNNFRLDKDILHLIIWEDAPWPCGDDHMTKSRNRKLIRVTSSKECLKHMCVDLSNYNRYLTKFGTEHKYHTINMPEWPNSHKLKIQDGGGRHLEFQKNVNNFRLDKDLLHQIIWEDASRPSRNRKLIREMSSNECLEHKCVDLSDYRRHLNQILYRAQAPHYKHDGMFQMCTTLDFGRRLVLRKMSITPNWMELFAQNLVGRCITAMCR